jgi:hypothetical protein
MKTNVYNVLVDQATLKHLKPGSAIIQTHSETGLRPARKPGRLRKPKSFHHTFTRSMVRKLGPKGIRFAGVAPRPIWTPGPRASHATGQGAAGGSAPDGAAGCPASSPGKWWPKRSCSITKSRLQQLPTIAGSGAPGGRQSTVGILRGCCARAGPSMIRSRSGAQRERMADAKNRHFRRGWNGVSQAAFGNAETTTWLGHTGRVSKYLSCSEHDCSC